MYLLRIALDGLHRNEVCLLLFYVSLAYEFRGTQTLLLDEFADRHGLHEYVLLTRMKDPPICGSGGESRGSSSECYFHDQVATISRLPILLHLVGLLGISIEEIIPFEVSGDGDGEVSMLAHECHHLRFPVLPYP